jgi:hypothetical protein
LCSGGPSTVAAALFVPQSKSSVALLAAAPGTLTTLDARIDSVELRRFGVLVKDQTENAGMDLVEISSRQIPADQSRKFGPYQAIFEPAWVAIDIQQVHHVLFSNADIVVAASFQPGAI